jgi:hypothetical protein
VSSQIITGAASALGGTSTATCPAGTVLLGGGADATPITQSLVVSKPQTAGVGGSWIAQGTAAAIVHAYAVCTT